MGGFFVGVISPASATTTHTIITNHPSPARRVPILYEHKEGTTMQRLILSDVTAITGINAEALKSQRRRGLCAFAFGSADASARCRYVPADVVAVMLTKDLAQVYGAKQAARLVVMFGDVVLRGIAEAEADTRRGQRAAHESGHALASRAVGSLVEHVTIVPDGEFAGKCVRRGVPSTSLHLLNEKAEASVEMPTTTDIITACAHIGAPEVGTARVDLAEEITRGQTLAIELVSGPMAELVMYPDLPPLPVEHDWAEARALASVVCASSSAVDAMLAYVKAEAEALIRDNIDIVEALTDALVAKGTLLSDEVDQIISACMARRAVAVEHEKRKRWQAVIASARQFNELCREPA
jgi:hypothetical protein